jgi:hypothetical protein
VLFMCNAACRFLNYGLIFRIAWVNFGLT